jgi:hypothetical protein
MRSKAHATLVDWPNCSRRLESRLESLYHLEPGVMTRREDQLGIASRRPY